jgi:hypothetical protein
MMSGNIKPLVGEGGLEEGIKVLVNMNTIMEACNPGDLGPKPADEKEIEKALFKYAAVAKKKCFKSGYSHDWYQVLIEVGADGKVADVGARDEKSPPAPASIECIKKALKGLVFPCLAGYQICPEYVIIE